MKLSPFHLAIPVDNLERSKKFYLEIIGCTLGRTAKSWTDLNFFGHQLVLHTVEANAFTAGDTQQESMKNSNQVDGKTIPVPHFGVVLPWDEWQALSQRLINLNIDFAVAPYIRFKGQVGEQATMFFYDPAGNALEFKAFKNIDQLFAS